MILCKLTDQDMKTHNGFQWELGVPAKPLTGEGGLCSPGFYHCYTHPLLAVLLNPIHARIENPRLFLIEDGGKSLNDNGLKMGFTEMTLVEEIPLPVITTEQRVRFAIYCALEVYDDSNFKTWAKNWLSGVDKSTESLKFTIWRTKGSTTSWRRKKALWSAELAEQAATWAAAKSAAEAAAEATWAAGSRAIDLLAIAIRACDET